MAQAAGKPVIVSDFPGAERSVTNGVEGLMTPGGDVSSLATAILDMAHAPQSWGPMGAAGRARVLAEFSEAASWCRLQALYTRAARTAT